MNKVVLVTGASRGIGAATARYLAQQGYDLVINYKSHPQKANALASELAEIGVNAVAIRADVSDETDVLHLFSEIDRCLGPISGLVNNAGILLPQTRLESLTAARINKILKTNVTSYFLCAREAVKRMSTSHGGIGGAIVNVSSAASRIGAPNEYIDYAASKGAIDTMTRGLSQEVAAENIRVNGVRPGFIKTEMHADGGEANRIERVKTKIPLGRGGEVEEVAAAIAWLLSDEASYVTGSFIDVAGGR